MSNAAGMVDIGGISASLNLDSGNLEEGLARGRKAMDAIAAEIRNLQAEFQRGGIQVVDFNDRMRVLADTQGELALKMRQAYAQIGVTGSGLDVFGHQMTAAGNGASNMGRGLLQASYLIDDLQYSISACVNNIGPLISAFGGGPGMAGAIQILAVGASLGISHWNEFKAAFGDTRALEESRMHIEGLQKQLKELKREIEGMPREGVVVKFQEVTEKIKTKQEAEKGAEALESFKTDEQKKATERYKQAVGEAGDFDALAKKVGNANYDAGGVDKFLKGSDLDEYNRLKRQIKADNPTYGTDKFNPNFMTIADQDKLKRVKGAEEKARKNAQDKAREFLGAGVADEDARRAVAEDAAARPDVYGPDLGAVLSGKKDTRKDAKKNKETADKNWTQAEKDDAEAGDKAIKDKRTASTNWDRAEVDDAKIADKEDAKRRKDKKTADDNWDKAERDDAKVAEDRRKQMLESAREKIPGLDAIADKAAVFEAAGITPKGSSQAAIAAALARDGGMDADDAAGAAEDVARQARKKLDNKVMSSYLHGEGRGEGQTPSKSEVYSTQGLTAKIQGSISDGESKKTNSLLERNNDLLAQLVNKKSLEIEVR